MRDKLRMSCFLRMSVLIFTMLSYRGYAEDLGTWGNSVDIAEEDLEKHIIKQLDAIGEDRLRQHQELIKNRMVAKIKRPREVKNISTTNSSSVRFYDPSFTVEEDIFGERGQLLYSKGTKINPLEKKEFTEVWLFIDGDDEKQTYFAKNYQEAQGKSEIKKSKKIILLKGQPGEQKDGSFFYFDQGGVISSKLGITTVPSIVRQDPNNAQILIEEVAINELKQNTVKTLETVK